MENCVSTSLSAFLKGDQQSQEIHSVYFMLYHALSFLADKGISHNDLHSNNIRIKSVQPVIVRFGDKQFFITCIPQIIDWDLSGEP